MNVLSQKIRSGLADFSPSERKIARALLADYPSSGLGSVQNLADLANVSSPSVVRFARHLGFEGFVDFQQALRNELSLQANGPLQRLESEFDGKLENDSGIQPAIDDMSRALRFSLENIPEYDLEQTIKLLSDPKKRIVIGGGRVSQSLADYLARHLQRMRSNVVLLPENRHQRIKYSLDASRRDVYVFLDFRRYQQDVNELAKVIAKQNATIILLTDVHLSPMSALAKVVLSVITESRWPFDTHIGGFALIEVIISKLMQNLGQAAVERMQDWDQLDSSNINGK
ncbi:MurR/RpiR family transcriptional regulator [Celerinatantimonas sp. MCCC 1A17872]|uniref:MurR/RpiR family transcriptional regulator n=1 Tax=Celerinatantimonas sp. MCCC 1A17872 TaxID=3177514 RepID=UPI0038C93101